MKVSADGSEPTPDRPRRTWLACLPPLLWILGTLGSTGLGCLLGGIHYQHTNGEPNTASYNEMRLYYEMIVNGGLIGAGVGGVGGALLLLLLSLLGK